MAYLTRAMLEPRVGGAVMYVELTDDDHDDVPDPLVEAFLLTDTDSTVNSYLTRGGYTTPMTDAAGIALLRPYLLDIANYKAKTRGGRLASERDVRAYEEALAWLETVASGDVILPGWTGVAVGSVGGVGTSDEPIMTNDNLKYL